VIVAGRSENPFIRKPTIFIERGEFYEKNIS
jgi:hypothetical protein